MAAADARIHIIGAGLAGLSAAVRLRHFGERVTVYEAAPRAGGRCRSFHDGQIGAIIDNGNHLLLSGNRSALAYAREIGAGDRFSGPDVSEFRFVDIADGQRWSVRAGLAPWLILDPRKRVPGTRIGDYWSLVRMMRAGEDDTVSACVDPGNGLYRRFWEPLCVAVLNTAPDQASAKLMRAVLKETIVRGPEACRPLIASESLAHSLIDPAVATITAAGVRVRMNARIQSIARVDDHVSAIEVEDDWVLVGRDDLVILAAPAWVAASLVPGLEVPPAGEPIVNVHYRLPQDAARARETQIIGLVGGMAQWVFVRGDIVSVTISAAESVVEEPAEMIATRCWAEVVIALALGSLPQPPARVIKERRATPAQTPAAVRLRPPTQSAVQNLLLAGDWTATDVPATIEGAVRSGFAAAAVAGARLGQSSDVTRGAA